MFLSESIQQKWQPVLDHPELPEVKDSYKRAVTSMVLENQEKALKEDSQFLNEAAPTNATGSSIQNWIYFYTCMIMDLHSEKKTVRNYFIR